MTNYRLWAKCNYKLIGISQKVILFSLYSNINPDLCSLPMPYLLKQCIELFRPGCPGYGHLSRRGLKDQTDVVSSSCDSSCCYGPLFGAEHRCTPVQRSMASVHKHNGGTKSILPEHCGAINCPATYLCSGGGKEGGCRVKSDWNLTSEVGPARLPDWGRKLRFT